jgi:diguanylate cyclase (GGDEF)-like protein
MHVTPLRPQRLASTCPGPRWSYVGIGAGLLMAFASLLPACGSTTAIAGGHAPWRAATYAFSATAPFLGFAVGMVFERLLALTRTDALTGLPNAAALDARLAERDSLPVAILVVLLDRPGAGIRGAVVEAILRKTAQVVAGAARSRDFVAHRDSREFVVVMPGTRAAEALVVAERIHRALAAASRCSDGPRIGVSIGVAEREAGPANMQALLELARRAQRSAEKKREGRTSLAPGAEPGRLEVRHGPASMRYGTDRRSHRV